MMVVGIDYVFYNDIKVVFLFLVVFEELEVYNFMVLIEMDGYCVLFRIEVGVFEYVFDFIFENFIGGVKK